MRNSIVETTLDFAALHLAASPAETVVELRRQGTLRSGQPMFLFEIAGPDVDENARKIPAGVPLVASEDMSAGHKPYGQRILRAKWLIRRQIDRLSRDKFADSEVRYTEE